MADRSVSVLMTLSDPNPDFEVTVLGKRLLYNTNRKLYPVYRLVAVLMTLNDLWPEFQGHGIFEVQYLHMVRLRDRKPYPNGSTVDDLAWPINASSGHVSISWASCLYLSQNLRGTEMQDQKTHEVKVQHEMTGWKSRTWKCRTT